MQCKRFISEYPQTERKRERERDRGARERKKERAGCPACTEWKGRGDARASLWLLVSRLDVINDSMFDLMGL